MNQGQNLAGTYATCTHDLEHGARVKSNSLRLIWQISSLLQNKKILLVSYWPRAVSKSIANLHVSSSFSQQCYYDWYAAAAQFQPLDKLICCCSPHVAVGLAANFLSFFVIESKRVGRFFLLFAGVIIMTGCMRKRFSHIACLVELKRDPFTTQSQSQPSILQSIATLTPGLAQPSCSLCPYS